MALTSANLIVCFAIPCACGIFVLADQAITLFSGAEFLDAVPATRILAINLFFSALDGFLGWQILVPNNRDKVLLGATVVGAVTDFMLNLLLIPRAGVEGAAAATMFSECCVFFICMAVSVRYMDFRRLGGHFIRCIFAIIPLFAIAFAVNAVVSSVIWSSVLTVGLTGIVYFLILFFLKDDFVIRIWKEAERVLIRKKTEAR